MPPFRNPFVRKPQNATATTNENLAPTVMVNGPYGEKVKSSTVSIRSQRSEPEELELGEVDDNGTYLPPSPPERKSMWRRTPTSTTVSSHNSVVSDNDGFSISRESFDSYRRSFDISARSPVIHSDSTYSRQSLDSLRTPYTPLSMRQASGRSFDSSRANDVKTVEEEGDVFEDVGLEDSKPQKKGIFSRFMKEENATEGGSHKTNTGSHRGFHIPGRKRGQSGQGSELGDMPREISNKGHSEEMKDGRTPEAVA